MVTKLIQQIGRSRQRRVDVDGSPFFPHSFGAIVATASERIDMESLSNGRAAKYRPFDFVEISNNSAETLEIEVNDNAGERVFLPAGVIKTISRRAIWNLRIVNVDATDTAAGEVRAVLQRLPIDADELARRKGR